MKLFLPSTLLALVLALAGPAGAQPITVTDTFANDGVQFAGGTAGTYQSNVSFGHSAVAGQYSFNLRGDVTAQFTGTANYFSYQGYAYATLVTGAAPVQLSNITLSYNGKEVPSGGSTASFEAYNFYRAALYVSGFGYDVYGDSFLPPRTAQGVFIEDLSTSLAGTYLAANTSYTLYMDVFPYLNLASYPAGSSMLGYALEYGGTVSPAFDGLTLSFNAVAVPEPGAWLLLACGLVAVLRTRRGGAGLTRASR
ncbi:MAG: hypothetical protein JNM33_02610 [Rubrivivax sp.]|nr:hypothetical protein [Rubrivivax sp.]